MNKKMSHTLELILGYVLFISGCSQSAISSTKAQATSVIAVNTLTTEIGTPTKNGLSIRETERVATVLAIQTAPATLLPTHTPTQTPTLEPTATPKPVSKNDVLVSYTRYAGDGADEITSCMAAYFSYRFVLYRDGHLIIFDKTRYLETKVNQAEIDRLLSEIEMTGFSSITGDGDQYIQNAPTPSFINGWGSSIKVGEKSISSTDTQSDYLIEPITRTLNIIESYRPHNLKPYVPESITLWVFSEQEAVFESFYPTPEPISLNWSTASIDLNNFVLDPFTDLPQDISGDALLFLIDQFKYFPAFRRVEQNGQHYLVLVECSISNLT